MDRVVSNLIIKGLITLLVISSNIFGINAQQNSLEFQSYTVNDGLSSNWVYCTLRDSYGYLWIGTRYGLNKYDGHTFTQYLNIPSDSTSISGNRITRIYEDTNGDIWIGTWQSGVNRYNREKNKFESFQYSSDCENCIASNYIVAMLQDDDGNMYFGTGDSGISKYNIGSKKFTTLQHSISDTSTLSANNIGAIIKGSNNEYWIATGEGTIDVYNSQKNEFRHIPVIDEIVESIRQRDVILFFDSDSLLWIGSAGGGLFTYNIAQQKYSKYPQLNNSYILDIIQIDDLIYIATDNGGVNIYNKTNKEFKYLKSNKYDNKSITSDGIYDLFYDEQNILWVSTFDAGLNFSSSFNNQFRNYYPIPNIEGTISHQNISSICQTSGGRIIIGTDGGGLNEFLPESEKFIKLRSGDDDEAYNDNYITCVYAKRNKLYVAAFTKGVSIYDLETGELKSIDQNFLGYKSMSGTLKPMLNVWSILEDTSGNLWVGTIDFGLYKFDHKKKEVYNFQPDSAELNSLSHRSVIYIYEDSDSNLWVATERGGLNKFNYNTNSFTHFVSEGKNSNSISNNSLNSIYEDSNGNLWIGTSGGGLNMFDRKGNKFTTYLESDGLPSNVVLDILEDDSGLLWITTTNGLCRFNSESKEFLSFTKEDGLQSNQYSQTSCLRAKNGLFYFGAVEGLTSFNPLSVKIDSNLPNLVFTDFKILNKSIDISKNPSYMDKHISNAPEINLTYHDYVFSVEFAALEYLNQEKVKYRYIMSGFDQQWNETDHAHRLITYTNLPGGKYTFLVQASKVKGHWSESISLDINVKPPFWRTAWFILIMIGLFISGFVAYYTFRTSFLKQQKDRLEKQVNERTDKIQRQNDKIFKQKSELEEHRNKLEEVVEKRTRDLVMAKERAEKADMLKTSFLANMSHEIRTPMNAILGFINILVEQKNELDVETESKYINIINSNGETLVTLVDDIIDIAKIESDQVEIIPTTFNLLTLLDGLFLEYTERQKLNKTSQVVFQLESSHFKEIQIKSDESRIRQALVNFIENAIKFTYSGSIKLGIKEVGQEIALYVKDTGIGIDTKHHKFIFDRFTKIEDRTDVVYRGTGIGLFISKRIIELLGFKIVLNSEVNKGSEFAIHIPQKEIITRLADQQTDTVYQQNYNWKGKTILIAEDEETNLDYIKIILQEQNVNILEATNGIEAVNISKERQDIDLILMDIKMPELDGMEATKQIRKFNSDVAIIAQTAYAMTSDRVKLLKLGCSDYISKPIKKQNLLNMLSKYL